MRATRTHSFFEVSGRGGHAQYTGDVNLKKLEDRVLRNDFRKSVTVVEASGPIVLDPAA